MGQTSIFRGEEWARPVLSDRGEGWVRSALSDRGDSELDQRCQRRGEKRVRSALSEERREAGQNGKTEQRLGNGGRPPWGQLWKENTYLFRHTSGIGAWVAYNAGRRNKTGQSSTSGVYGT